MALRDAWGWRRVADAGCGSGTHLGLLRQLDVRVEGFDLELSALAAGVRVHGCTVHFVTPQLDHGPIIIQAAVPVYHEDTEESLSERILKLEHKIYPETIRLFAEGRLKVEGRRVKITGKVSPEDYIVNPPLTFI